MGEAYSTKSVDTLQELQNLDNWVVTSRPRTSFVVSETGGVYTYDLSITNPDGNETIDYNNGDGGFERFTVLKDKANTFEAAQTWDLPPDAEQSGDPLHTVWSTLARDPDNNQKEVWISEAGELWIHPEQNLVWGRPDNFDLSAGHIQLSDNRYYSPEYTWDFNLAGLEGGMTWSVNDSGGTTLDAMRLPNGVDDPVLSVHALDVRADDGDSIKLNLGTAITSDDTPYNYLKAWTVNSGWPLSFDGIHDTNGQRHFISWNAELVGGTRADPKFLSNTAGAGVVQGFDPVNDEYVFWELGLSSSEQSLTATKRMMAMDTVSNDVTVPNGGFAIHGQSVPSQPTYTPSNVTTTRTFDANNTTLDELADVVGTIIADNQSYGFFG